MRGHRLWTQNARRRNSSLRTSASAAYTHPPPSSSGIRKEIKQMLTHMEKDGNQEKRKSEACILAGGSTWLGSTSFRLKTTGSYACHNLLSCLLSNWRVMTLCGDSRQWSRLAQIHMILKWILQCGRVKRGLARSCECQILRNTKLGCRPQNRQRENKLKKSQD